MREDSYHTPDGRSLGLRIGHMLRTERIGVSCATCGQAKVFDWDTLRRFRRDLPIAWLGAIMQDICATKRPIRLACDVEVITPEIGCSDEG